MAVPSRNKNKKKASNQDEVLLEENSQEAEELEFADDAVEDQKEDSKQSETNEQPEVMPEKPAVVPLIEREILPEVLYSKKTFKNGATLNGVLIDLRAGMPITDRYMAWTLLKQGVELVETLAECD
jgi:hypothetical protein